MVRIDVQGKPLFLIDKPSPEVEDYLHRPDTIFTDDLNTTAIETVFRQLEKIEVYAGIIQHPDIDKTLETIKSYLTPIEAAGGLVYTKDLKILLIFRKGKWDLPKGKLDEGEELEACALREVEEETGASQLKIMQPLHISYHTYYEKKKHVLKVSHWYLMETEHASTLVPQTEEDIEKCEWVALGDLDTYMTNMHASVIDVIRKAKTILPEKNS